MPVIINKPVPVGGTLWVALFWKGDSMVRRKTVTAVEEYNPPGKKTKNKWYHYRTIDENGRDGDYFACQISNWCTCHYTEKEAWDLLIKKTEKHVRDEKARLAYWESCCAEVKRRAAESLSKHKEENNGKDIS